MVRTPSRRRSGCPINFGLEIFGDRWSLLILRDMLILGKKTFKEFQQSEEGIASNILAERLTRLEDCGIIRSGRAPQDARQVIYGSTPAGQKLLPVLLEMSYWGAIHDKRTAAPQQFVEAYEKDRDGLLKAIASGFNPTERKLGR